MGKETPRSLLSKDMIEQINQHFIDIGEQHQSKTIYNEPKFMPTTELRFSLSPSVKILF